MKLYVYDHCPFCVKARAIFGLKGLRLPDLGQLLTPGDEAHREGPAPAAHRLCVEAPAGDRTRTEVGGEGDVMPTRLAPWRKGADTISGNGLSPQATTSLLAWWAARGLGDQGDLMWLAAISLIGDMADDAGFPELADAQQRWGKTVPRDAVSLVNAPRRTAAADAGPALQLLLKANGPKEITKGHAADALALHAAKAEVCARPWTRPST